MRWRLCLLGAFLTILSQSVAARADVKDPAELFPTDTLAYLELRQPDRLARELAALFKGSALENMHTSLAKFREKMPDHDNWWPFHQVTEFGLFLSPEVLSEVGRMKGGAFAITGFSLEDGP